VATLPAGRVLEVRYESVVADPMTAAGLLADFLGTTPAGHAALREGFARARADSVGRWRKAVSGGQLREMVQEIGPLLARLGYE
jgi:hypothetical protein